MCVSALENCRIGEENRHSSTHCILVKEIQIKWIIKKRTFLWEKNTWNELAFVSHICIVNTTSVFLQNATLNFPRNRSMEGKLKRNNDKMSWNIPNSYTYRRDQVCWPNNNQQHAECSALNAEFEGVWKAPPLRTHAPDSTINDETNVVKIPRVEACIHEWLIANNQPSTSAHIRSIRSCHFIWP